MPEFQDLDPVIDTTEIVSRVVSQIEDPLWKLELSGSAAMSFAQEIQPESAFKNLILQVTASAIGLISFLMVALRYRGTGIQTAREALRDTATVFALHGEDSSRTRHVRTGLLKLQDIDAPILLLGRPSGTVRATVLRLDPDEILDRGRFIRPITINAALSSLPDTFRLLLDGVKETGRYRAPLPFRERVAIAFRMALGAAFANWWLKIGGNLRIRRAVFGHTGNADSSQLELAMQGQRIQTVHAVHGSNVGWAFAGLSDIAVFQSGADARLGASLPAYGLCTYLPIERPFIAQGNGDWALLTAYTHTLNPAFIDHGALPDCQIVQLVAEAANKFGQDLARIFWRPHPQISMVDPIKRERLLSAVENAGFTYWPPTLPYEALSEFSLAITTPSTALINSLRFGQPAIVASALPIQRDHFYGSYPLLARNQDQLTRLIGALTLEHTRSNFFEEAWHFVEPGGQIFENGRLRLPNTDESNE